MVHARPRASRAGGRRACNPHHGQRGRPRGGRRQLQALDDIDHGDGRRGPERSQPLDEPADLLHPLVLGVLDRWIRPDDRVLEQVLFDRRPEEPIGILGDLKRGPPGGEALARSAVVMLVRRSSSTSRR